jgi:hypothetical protein
VYVYYGSDRMFVDSWPVGAKRSGLMKWAALSAEVIRFHSVEEMDRSITVVKIRPRKLR